MNIQKRFSSPLVLMTAFMLTVFALLSAPLYATELKSVAYSPVLGTTVQLQSANNVFIYNPSNGAVTAAVAGQTLPAGAVVYIKGANSSATISQNGQAVELKTPGFFNATGEAVELSQETMDLIADLAEAVEVAEQLAAESVAEESDSGVSDLQIDDPQAVTSPAN